MVMAASLNLATIRPANAGQFRDNAWPAFLVPHHIAGAFASPDASVRANGSICRKYGERKFRRPTG